MHPGMMWWLKQARRAAGDDRGVHVGEGGGRCGPSARPGWGGGARPGWGGGERWEAETDYGGGGPFGVRRPLRFLAYKLELDDAQVSEIARILDDLKTERAQAAVDQRRTGAAFADALGGESFDAKQVAEAAALRVKSAERIRDAVVRALTSLHGVLRPEQRAKLATLIRTGAVVI